MDIASVIVLLINIAVATKVVRGFRESRNALTESASVISTIVAALNWRIELTEQVVKRIRLQVNSLVAQTGKIGGEEPNVRSSYLQLLRRIEEMLSNDRRLIQELEYLKAKVSLAFKPSIIRVDSRGGTPKQFLSDENMMASLTDTEREALEMMCRDGSTAAPDLGKKLRKSREHTSRLMKKLYLEGYIDRESNRPPYRYKLTDRVRHSLDSTSGKTVTAKVLEKA